MKKGFTLVELSIVLVIIGLLIGGILVGQSLIESAKINAVAQQIQQFDAGAMAFKSKYKYIPGDAPAFGGDGNGVLNASGAITTVKVVRHACELANFWNNMSPNLYASSLCASPGVKATVSGTGKNVPASKLGTSGSFFIASAMSDGAGNPDMTAPANYYAILAGSQVQNLSNSWYSFAQTSSTNSAVKPADLMALDQKLDDGKANSGTVLAGKINFVAGGDGAITATSPLAACNVTSTYTVANNTYECTPLIRMGGSGGNPL